MHMHAGANMARGLCPVCAPANLLFQFEEDGVVVKSTGSARRKAKRARKEQLERDREEGDKLWKEEKARLQPKVAATTSTSCNLNHAHGARCRDRADNDDDDDDSFDNFDEIHQHDQENSDNSDNSDKAKERKVRARSFTAARAAARQSSRPCDADRDGDATRARADPAQAKRDERVQWCADFRQSNDRYVHSPAASGLKGVVPLSRRLRSTFVRAIGSIGAGGCSSVEWARATVLSSLHSIARRAASTAASPIARPAR